jgi:hemerythrin-like domain-containing protein
VEILREEHRLIEGVLDALELGAHRLGDGSGMSADFFVAAVDFIRGFADDAHHRKEEGVLFKAMARHGFSEETGPVAMMLFEHGEARRFTASLGEAAERLQRGDESAREDVITYALAYVRLLRQHIMKEDNILFEMAGRVIPAAEHGGIEAGFEKVEHDELAPGVQEKYRALALSFRDRAG